MKIVTTHSSRGNRASLFSGDGGGAGSSPVSVTGTVPVQTVAPTATRFVQSIQGGRKRRALSHETRPRRLFLTAAVGIGQAVRPRFPRHAPACSGVSPWLVLRPFVRPRIGAVRRRPGPLV